MDMSSRIELRRAALSGGDEAKEAFRILWSSYRFGILGFARSILAGAKTDPEDASQEILIRAFRKIGSYDPLYPLEPWLFALARRYCLGVIRAEGRRTRREREACEPRLQDPADHSRDGAESAGGGIAEEIAARSEVERMERLVAEVPPGDRALIDLFYREGMKSEEIGAAMGIPAGTVRWRLGQARKRLRKAMEEGDGR